MTSITVIQVLNQSTLKITLKILSSVILTSKKWKILSKDLTWKKAAQKDDIKINLLKTADFLTKYIFEDIIDISRFSKFPNELKQADIVPARKTVNLFKKNYRSIITLLNVSQIYERCLYDQLATYFDYIFSR